MATTTGTTAPFEARPRDGRPAPRVAPGTLVKVGRERERFWCRVATVGADGALVATVDNHLLRNADLAYGEAVRLRLEHILETATPADEASFVDLVRRHVREGRSDPLKHAAGSWWEARLRDGIAVPPRPDALAVVGRP